MSAAALPVPQAAVPPVFDSERLAKQTYLTGPEAAYYLGYTREHYSNPYGAFHKLIRRNGVRPGYIGRRLLFKRADLDALISRARS